MRVTLLLLGLGLVACKSAPPMPAPAPATTATLRYEVLKERHPGTGRLQREWTVKVEPGKRAVQHGRERLWFAAGTLEWEREWKDGQPHAVWTRYWPNGVARSRTEYRGADVVTMMTFWHENGAKAYEGPARNGERCGEWSGWRADGTLAERGSYEDSFKTGEWAIYATDGATEEHRVVFDRSVRVRTLPAAAPQH
jgi:antitoxin component YwqK of YwqJK toxin-antitoxin module